MREEKRTLHIGIDESGNGDPHEVIVATYSENKDLIIPQHDYSAEKTKEEFPGALGKRRSLLDPEDLILNIEKELEDFSMGFLFLSFQNTDRIKDYHSLTPLFYLQLLKPLFREDCSNVKVYIDGSMKKNVRHQLTRELRNFLSLEELSSRFNILPRIEGDRILQLINSADYLAHAIRSFSTVEEYFSSRKIKINEEDLFFPDKIPLCGKKLERRVRTLPFSRRIHYNGNGSFS